MTSTFSRRAVLAQIAGGGSAATLGILAAPSHGFAEFDARPWAFLTDSEAQWLAAVCDVFIPEDDFPSASQAGVIDYIDLQLATGYGQGDGLYLKGPFPKGTLEQGYQLPLTPSQLVRRGIAGVRDGGEPDITALDVQERMQFVQALSEETAELGEVPAPAFFSEILSLTNEGYFADPIYLGNHDYAGWKMVGFPGAHAYYLERVDAEGPHPAPPPMGIAHDRGQTSTLPRPIKSET